MPALTAEQKARRIAAMKEEEEDMDKRIKETKKKAEEYSKTPEAIKYIKQVNEVKPIVQQFVDEEITYSELKNFVLKNNISSDAYDKGWTDILSQYDTNFYEVYDYDELNKKDQKLWRDSYNNQKLLKPIRVKLNKLSDLLEEKEIESKKEEQKKKSKKEESDEESGEESDEEKPKKETKKEVKKETKKEVKKETKKPIIVKLQKLCKELNEESDEE